MPAAGEGHRSGRRRSVAGHAVSGFDAEPACGTLAARSGKRAPLFRCKAVGGQFMKPQTRVRSARQRRLMDYRRRIVRHPKLCGGEPVLKGTRVTLRTVLASLAEGATVQEGLEDFPTLTEDDVRAAIAFRAASAPEDIPLPE